MQIASGIYVKGGDEMQTKWPSYLTLRLFILFANIIPDASTITLQKKLKIYVSKLRF